MHPRGHKPIMNIHKKWYKHARGIKFGATDVLPSSDELSDCGFSFLPLSIFSGCFCAYFAEGCVANGFSGAACWSFAVSVSGNTS